MRNIPLCCTLLYLALVFSVAAKTNKGPAETSVTVGVSNATVLIVRHAEKPAIGSGLTSKGDERAAGYPDFFKTYLVDGKPLKITSLYAAADTPQSRRPRLTLEPLSAALKLTINTQFKDREFAKLARELETKVQGGTILIAWRHGEISGLLQALNADPDTLLAKGHWPADVYNWVIELRYDAQGKLVSSRRVESNR